MERLIFCLDDMDKNATVDIKGLLQNSIFCHPRESGDPEHFDIIKVMDSRFHGNDAFYSFRNRPIKAEERGNKEDKMLISHFNSILDRGTFFISSERLKKRIISFKFHNKRSNINGLQIADLNAYPLARNLLNPKEPYVPFEILEDKIYCNKKGERDGWGLKVFS